MNNIVNRAHGAEKRNYISPLTENIQLAGETMMDSFNIMTGSGSTFNDMTDID